MKQLKKPVPYKRPDTGKWGCDFEELVDGKVVRRKKYAIYDLKTDAQTRCNQIHNQQNPKERKSITKLTNAQQQEAAWAFEELAKFDVTKNSLRSAVRYYVENYREAGETRSVAEVVATWLAKKEKQLQPTSYAPLRSRLNHFKDQFPCQFGEVDSQDLIDFIEKQSPGMQRKWFIHLGELYNYFCHKSNPNPELNHNPWEQVAFYFDGKLSETNRTPTILHLDEIKVALKIAKDFKSEKGEKGEFLGVVVLGIFCGMRPSEVQNLAQQEKPFGDFIQLRKKCIRVTEDICRKTRAVRTIELKPNAVQWLKYIKDKKLPISPNPYKYQKYNGALRKKILGDRAKLKAWNDVYRHTFVTFLYNTAIEEKENLSFDYILSQVGHSMQVQEKHYRGTLRDDEKASDLWKVTPISVDKVQTS